MNELDVLLNIESVLSSIEELILVSNYQSLIMISLILLIIAFFGFLGVRR